MRNILYKILGVVLLVFILSSCKGFLDEDPQSVINTENFYQTEDDAIAATNAIYDFLSVGNSGLWDMGFGGVFFNNYWVIQDVLSDNCFENGTFTYYQLLSDFRHTPENQGILDMWQDFYQVINAANVCLERIPAIDMNIATKNHLLAEAYFFRGMMYFELIKFFGDVPLLLKPISGLSESYPSRVKTEDIYIQVIEDLENAINNFGTFRAGNGVPDVMIAKALLSKVYLFKGDYQKSVDFAEEVISSGRYNLEPDYDNIFKLENMHKGEIILGINFSGTLSQGFKPNQFLVRLLPSGLDQDGEGPTNAHGWERPTDELYDSFEPLDRRRHSTFITSFTYSDGSTKTFEPHISKYWDQEAEPRGNSSDMDFVYLRYADILLVYAEALNELNGSPTEDAYEAINKVRKRARFDGTVEQNVLPDLSGLSYQDFRDAILLERRWEFVMEGHRWSDLVRFGKLVETIENSDKKNALPKAHHNKLPIPQREISLNPNLTQNTDY